MSKCLFCKKPIRDMWYIAKAGKKICMSCAMDIRGDWARLAEEMRAYDYKRCRHEEGICHNIDGGGDHGS